MPTITELIHSGVKRMRRPCWVGAFCLLVESDNRATPDFGYLFETEDTPEGTRIPLGPFIEFSDFYAVTRRRKRANKR